MVATSPIPQKRELIITWERPPADFQLDDTPVENTGQPLVAGALRESLELAGRIRPENLIASNFGLCATVNHELTIKAPDWLYVARVNQGGIPRKTYTPYLEGETPAIVMEFLSDSDGGEYSHRQIPPIGKWFFYEQILKVPTYVVFEPDIGLLEVYRLQDNRYSLEQPDENGRHWFQELELFLGTWRGAKEGRSGYWLRWWDKDGQILPWAVEQIEQERQRAEQERQRAEQERQRAEQERQRAEQERQRAERLAELLRSQGIDPEVLP
ncbi:MAG TPA: Uma2 family endonuclease [Synechococcales cyanobacterium M55_K2018_004]|nr:Uma2 family endonuclease [Synechococcales cyanobacterium M55_K2018_004]